MGPWLLKAAKWAYSLTLGIKDWRFRVGAVVGIVGVAVVLWYATGGKPPDLPDVPPDWFKPGWVDDKQAVAAVVAEMPIKAFADTPAFREAEAEPKFVYLWDAVRKVNGGKIPVKNQNPIGSCVSFGTNTALERTLAVDVATLRRAEWMRIAEEVTYAGSRVEVGGGRISGDGSVGAWAADFVRRWGVVGRAVHGQYDLTEYNPERCRSWGRSGVPAELEEVARQRPVKDTTRVTTWDEAKKALASGYGIAICSNQGFSRQRDANGVARAAGSWAHCMCLDGYHIDDNGREYGHIENSWGPDYHVGPVGWGEPTTAGFWAESSVVERMLRQKDSWAFSGVKGFPLKRLDWRIRRNDRPAREVFDEGITRRFAHGLPARYRAGEFAGR